MHQPIIGAQASRLARDLKLHNLSVASTIPRLVYGTAWKKAATADLVYTALKSGFRGVDTAAQPKHYNEPAVGAGVKRAIAEGVVKRNELFTKFTSPSGQSNVMPYDIDAPLVEMVRQSVESSLRSFTVDEREPYLDSLVLHSPMNTIQETLVVWKTLESFVPAKIRNLGISNATLEVVEELYRRASLKPAVVQNRFYPETSWEVDLRAFCREHDIVFQSFWTLTSNMRLVRSTPVTRLARSTDVEVAPAYYCLVLGLEGLTILNGTTNETRMKEDLEAVEKIGAWAEGEGAAEWESILSDFKTLIGEF